MNAGLQYLQHLQSIVHLGTRVTARGLNFIELMGAVYEVPMIDPVATVEGRKLGLRFAAAEPYWVLSGNNLLADITNFGKMAPYSDDGYFMSGAYGPKIVDQLGYICKTLAEDQGSRQAVLTIWRERPGKSKDIPCTVSMQFMIRDNKLHCLTTMRSSDAIMGLPYDSILFSLTSAYIISILRSFYGVSGLKLGQLKVFLGSAHIYDRDEETVASILRACNFYDNDLDFNKMAALEPADFLDRLQSFAMNSDKNGILEIAGL